MNNEGPKEESRVHYATALHHKHSQQPIIRRRHSGLTREPTGSHNSLPSRRNHLQTDSNGNRNDGGHRHPLTLDHNGSLDTSGVTRPHLSRTLKRASKDDHDPNEVQANGSSFRKEVEAEVVVHEVIPTDSLAGVSLRYGISLADLRKANHLWANDSIHLRKVLYIPLDMSLRARDLARDIKANAASLVDTLSSIQGSNATAESNDPPSSPDTPVGSGLGVLRVPTSRMSFFPPPATSGKTPSVSSTSSLPFVSNVKSSSFHARYSTSPSLSSILTALPISASTRDDLIARLSFDSTSSSVSERSRPSLDHLEGHELDVVNHEQMPPELSRVTHRLKDTSKAADPHVSSLFRSLSDHERKTPLTARPTQPRNVQARNLSTTPPAMYIPQIPDHTSIRTIQMEPSPIMQLPILRSRKSQLPSANGISTYTPRRPQDDLIELE